MFMFPNFLTHVLPNAHARPSYLSTEVSAGHQPDLAESKSSFDILPCDLDVPLEVTTKVRISGLYPQYKTFIGSL